MTGTMLSTRLERALQLMEQIRDAEAVLDELFFSKPTASIAPPPVDFFRNYTDSIYHEVRKAKDLFQKSDGLTALSDNAPCSSQSLNAIEYPENFGEIIGHRIKRYRKEKGMTQNQLAEQTGIRRPNIARLEKGHSLPNLTTLLKVSSALSISLENMLKI